MKIFYEFLVETIFVADMGRQNYLGLSFSCLKDIILRKNYYTCPLIIYSFFFITYKFLLQFFISINNSASN